MTGIELIAKERERQIKELGYDVKNDDLYSKNELANAAVCYAVKGEMREIANEDGESVDEILWPWTETTFNPTPEDRIKELTKAGALIAAQIDREIYDRNKDITLTVVIEQTSTGFCCYAKEMDGLISVGSTIEEIEVNFKEVIHLSGLEGCKVTIEKDF